MRWLRGLSIRTRITVQTLAVALVLCSIAAIGFRASVESIVNATAVQLAENDSASFEAAIRDSPKKPTLTVGEDQQVEITRPDGSIARSTIPLGLYKSIARLKGSSDQPRKIETQTSTYFVVIESVEVSGGSWLIVAARSGAQGALLLQSLTLTLMIGALVLVIGFGIAAWVLTGAALRPVTAMRRNAERLSDTDTLDELPVGGADDELAALATTLNRFIERNRSTIEREKQMLSDTSHELRTPIAILSAQLELAASPERELGEVREEVASARRIAARLATLATNLLELAKIDAGTSVRPTEWTELSLELAASIDRARLLAQPSGVVVDFSVDASDESIPYGVTAASFASLIDNLLTNAIAATPTGGAVQVGVVQREAELRVSVVDTGQGMPAEFISVAFDRFTRPSDSRERALGGNGLGLAIVHAIVTAAHGRVTLENRSPGMAVEIVLPAAGLSLPE